MKKVLLIALCAVAVTGCVNVRENQKAKCEAAGGRYIVSEQDPDDDVCVFSKDPNTRVEFYDFD